MNETLLEARDLRILIARSGLPPLSVLQGVSLTLRRGEVLGLIGSSGAGKTLTALAILRLLPPSARLASGTLSLLGRDLLSLTEKQMRSVRGKEAALIAQEPASALDPLARVGSQLSEGLRDHLGLSRSQAEVRCRDWFAQMALPASCLRAYPHQLSGGMRQRVLIAMALCCEPALIIADEPTTALDAFTRRQILDLLLDWVRRTRAGLLLISHEPGVILPRADRIAVLQKGQILCCGSPSELLGPGGHAGARCLLGATGGAELAALTTVTRPGGTA
jgi:ABC-type glutathione transport system ATPase component